jgi:hypothetical protein
MFALSAPLIGYSGEVKPYAWDLLAAVGMTLLCLRSLPGPEGGRAPTLALLAGFLVALAVVTAPFVLVAAGSVLALGAAQGRDQWPRRRLLLAVAGWMMLFVLVWVVFYRPVSRDPAMQRFWEAAYLDLTDPAASWRVHRRWLAGLLIPDDALGLLPGHASALTALLVVGAVASWRREGALRTIALAGPLGLAYCANALRLYPFEVRLMLFAAPAAIILSAAGMEAVANVAGRRLRLPVYAAGALLILLPFVAPVVNRTAPGMLEEVRPLIREGPLPASREPLYVFGRAGPAWLYYTTRWDGDGRLLARQVIAMGRALGPNMGNRPSRGDSVRAEGDELRLEAYGRTVLLGVPSGIENVFRTTWAPLSVDPGWGENEARRIRNVGTRCFFVLFAHYRPVQALALQHALESLGARRLHLAVRRGAELSRYCWSDAGPGLRVSSRGTSPVTHATGPGVPGGEGVNQWHGKPPDDGSPHPPPG